MKISGMILRASDFEVSNGRVYIKKHENYPGMLLLKADWCGHCNKFIPTFNEISENIERFTCASIDNEELEGNNMLISALDFDGFPTIYYFDNKGMVLGKHDGGRDKSSILKGMCKTYHYCFEN